MKAVGVARLNNEPSSQRANHPYLGKNISAEEYLRFKEHSPWRLFSPMEQEVFLHEAEFLQRLKHPHILAIISYGMDEEVPYIITDYVPMRSLATLLRRQWPKPLELSEALEILAQVGEALHYAHQSNIVHGNLKPDCIYLKGQREVLLANFRLTSLAGKQHVQEQGLSDEQVYRAPEQLQGFSSKESDQYTLGCLTYEMLTGEQPFIDPQAKQAEKGEIRKAEHLIAPRVLNPSLSPDIEKAILKAMQTDPEQRYPTIIEFLAALQVPEKSFVGASEATGDAPQATKDHTQVAPIATTTISGASLIMPETAESLLQTLATGQTGKLSQADVEATPQILVAGGSSRAEEKTQRPASEASQLIDKQALSDVNNLFSGATKREEGNEAEATGNIQAAEDKRLADVARSETQTLPGDDPQLWERMEAALWQEITEQNSGAVPAMTPPPPPNGHLDWPVTPAAASTAPPTLPTATYAVTPHIPMAGSAPEARVGSLPAAQGSMPVNAQFSSAPRTSSTPSRAQMADARFLAQQAKRRAERKPLIFIAVALIIASLLGFAGVFMLLQSGHATPRQRNAMAAAANNQTTPLTPTTGGTPPTVAIATATGGALALQATTTSTSVISTTTPEVTGASPTTTLPGTTVLPGTTAQPGTTPQATSYPTQTTVVSSTATPGVTAVPTATATPTATPSPTATATPTPTAVPVRAYRYSFEDGGTDGWTAMGNGNIQNSTAVGGKDGSHALQMVFQSANSFDSPSLGVNPGGNVAGLTMTAYVYIPSSTTATISVNLYADAGTRYGSGKIVISQRNTWVQVGFRFPSFSGSAGRVAVQFTESSPFNASSTVYVDAVNWG